MKAAPRRESRVQLPGETLQFMQRLWALSHALEVRSKAMARDLGVTGPQRLVIRMIGQFPEASARDVSSTLGMHPSTLTGVLARLEAQKLILRKADLVDRRIARFQLTATGEQIDRARKGTVEAAVRRALGRAGESTIDGAIVLLDLLTAELERG